MNRLTLKLRSVARRTGILPLIQFIRPRGPYEAQFGKALLDSVRPGDVVWDVGANVGFYTRQFIEKVGPTGSVVAFEPEPQCAEILRRECARALLINAALSDRCGNGFLEFHEEPANGAHQVVDFSPDAIPIQTLTGDTFEGPRPNVVKIDVEGLEQEVLAGMPRVLAEPRLRAIFIEVDFALLEARGRREAPLHIERSLRDLGFSTRWLANRSHLVAYRHPQK